MAVSEHREEVKVDAAQEAADAALRQLDVARGREAHLSRQVEQLEERLVAMEQKLGELGRLVRARSDLIAEIQHTRSWRWTAPFRVLRRLLGR
jgi:hypothetical protein